MAVYCSGCSPDRERRTGSAKSVTGRSRGGNHLKISEGLVRSGTGVGLPDRRPDAWILNRMLALGSVVG